MKKINCNKIEEQGYKLLLQAEKEEKTKKIMAILLLEEEEQGRVERTLMGKYTMRSIEQKEYMVDLGDRIPYFALCQNEKKARVAKKGTETTDAKAEKSESELIHEQIVEYCLTHKAEVNVTKCGIFEAYRQVIEYVRGHANKSFWYVKEQECIVQYDRLDELLRLVDCEWYDRTEFSNALKLNDLIYAGKDGRTQTKKGTKWVLKIKVQEGNIDER